MLRSFGDLNFFTILQNMKGLLLQLCLSAMFLLGISTTTRAGKYYDFSPRANNAYQNILSLRLTEARYDLDQMRLFEQDNLIYYYLESYLDFLTVFVNDNKSEYNRMLAKRDNRLGALAMGDIKSPYNLYTQAEVRLQWAYLQGRYGNYMGSLSDIKQAYALLEENQRRFPWFVANKKSLGILHALVGNVPEDYKWVIRTLGGMNGTTEQGVRELEEVLQYAKSNTYQFEEETLICYAMLQLFLNNQQEKAWTTLKTSKLNPTYTPLAAYAMATVAMRTGKNDEAIKLLQEMPAGANYAPFHHRNFLLGVAKLRRLDTDAYKPLQDFLNNFKGSNTVKEAYQKLAWFHLLSDNPSGYQTYINYAKIKGADHAEPDQAALREAKKGEIPDPLLLRARLLFDGGYYQRAFDLLKNAGGQYQNQHKLNLEYRYRLGRIAQKLGKSAEAIQYYQQTINSGSKDPWYFACNAALQLGQIYEGQKNYTAARLAYKQCLGMQPEEYATSLHAQAKSGLQRCEKK